MNKKGRIGIYVHWPFCLTKCPYCDFNVHTRQDIDHEVWREAYSCALDHYAALTAGREVASIFFGGGTPSLMEPETVAALIDRVSQLWPCAPDLEITLEANPTSVEMGRFEAFSKAGVNRVSLGIQALNDKDLSFLGRKHDARQALQALETAKACFKRVSFDLIYARPEQTLDDWEKELAWALGYARGHLSLYQLTIERSTPFYFDEAQGKFSMPDEDEAADFYHLTQDILEEGGLPAYEVSNHAATGQESRHNLIYWHYGDYIGIGPGAHGRLTLAQGQKQAFRDHAAPEVWLERVGKSGTGAHPPQHIPPEERFTEALMMGLRLREGVAVSHLETQAACALDQMIDRERLCLLQEQGWIFAGEDRLALSREGLLRLNAIVPYLLKTEARRQRLAANSAS